MCDVPDPVWRLTHFRHLASGSAVSVELHRVLQATRRFPRGDGLVGIANACAMSCAWCARGLVGWGWCWQCGPRLVRTRQDGMHGGGPSTFLFLFSIFYSILSLLFYCDRDPVAVEVQKTSEDMT